MNHNHSTALLTVTVRVTMMIREKLRRLRVNLPNWRTVFEGYVRSWSFFTNYFLRVRSKNNEYYPKIHFLLHRFLLFNFPHFFWIVSRESWVASRESRVASRESRVVSRESWAVSRESSAVSRESWVVSRESWVVSRESWIVDCESWIVNRESPRTNPAMLVTP